VVVLRERIEKYIKMMERAIEELEPSIKSLPLDTKELIENVKLYINDSKNYLKENKIFEALSCISYAEGLLDALNFMNLLKIDWKRFK